MTHRLSPIIIVLEINHLHDLYGKMLIGWFLVKYWSSLQSLKGQMALSSTYQRSANLGLR